MKRENPLSSDVIAELQRAADRARLITMSNNITPNGYDDLALVVEHLASGKPLSQAVVERVLERSQKAQEELLQKHGVREIAVDLIREGREE